MEGIERKMEVRQDSQIKLNNPKDFFDYSVSYFLPETKERIEAAYDKLITEIGKILEDDRLKAKEKEMYEAALKSGHEHIKRHR